MAHTIKTETKVGGNTADRVGSAFEGVADALEGTEQIAEMDKAVQEVQQQVDASKAQIQSLVNALPVVQQTGDSTTSVMSQKAVSDKLSDLSETVDEVIIKDKIISIQKGKTAVLKHEENIPAKYVSKDILYMSVLSSDDSINIAVTIYDSNKVPLYFETNSKKNFALKIPLEKKYIKYSIYAKTESEETKNVAVSVIFGFNTYNLKNVDIISKSVDTISKSVDTIVRSCRYRGNITVEGKTVKFGVGYIYLYTTKGNYSVQITEEKVFENIAQNNMFIVADTANGNEITTRNEGSDSDNTLNRITDIPLLYWDSNIVYGCLANYLISKNVDAVSKNVDAVSKNVDTVSKNVDTVSKNVDTVSKNVDTTICRNKNVQLKVGRSATLISGSPIVNREDEALYVTVLITSSNRDFYVDIKAYDSNGIANVDETLTYNKGVNAIRIPIKETSKSYSIYVRPISENFEVKFSYVTVGKNAYNQEQLKQSIYSNAERITNIEDNTIKIPANIKEEIGTTFRRFSSWNAGKDKIVFPVFTDIHAGFTFNKIKQLENLIDNFNQFGFDFYANLGDVGIDVAYTNGGLDASYKLLNYISDVSNTANAPVLFANGNHETIVKELPTRVRKEYLNKPQERKWKGLKYADGGNNGTYFNEEKDLKVIILDNYARADTDNNPSYLTYEGIDKEQLSWFINELTKAKDIENIIVLEHCFPNYKGNWRSEKEEGGQTIYEDPAANDDYCPSRASIRNTIIAFNKRQIGTDSVYNDVSYDFSNATGTICGLFSGHSHFDVHHQEDGLLLVCHQSMGDLDLEKNMPSWGIHSEFDKLTNTLIDVVSICPSTRQIKIFRVGAGGQERDREFSY